MDRFLSLFSFKQIRPTPAPAASPKAPVFTPTRYGLKLIAKSSQACAYRPGREIDGTVIPGTIIKLFGIHEKKAYEKEVHSQSRIESFDPEEKFTAKLLRHGSMPRDMVDTKCFFMDGYTHNTYYYILYRDAGRSIASVINSLITQETPVALTLEEIICAASSLFEGLVAYDKAKVAHGDINENNILLDEQRGRMVFIDNADNIRVEDRTKYENIELTGSVLGNIVRAYETYVPRETEPAWLPAFKLILEQMKNAYRTRAYTAADALRDYEDIKPVVCLEGITAVAAAHGFKTPVRPRRLTYTTPSPPSSKGSQRSSRKKYLY